MLTDPGRYGYVPLIDRPIIRWPENARVVFWIAPNIEFYEIDPPDGQGRPLWPRPYPDVLNYSLRYYGNRAGVWRVMESLERFGILTALAPWLGFSLETQLAWNRCCFSIPSLPFAQSTLHQGEPSWHAQSPV
jgi:hypothetical protein